MSNPIPSPFAPKKFRAYMNYIQSCLEDTEDELKMELKKAICIHCCYYYNDPEMSHSCDYWGRVIEHNVRRYSCGHGTY